MSWLFVAIISYFILAVVNLVDKRLLISLIPNPRIYAFNVGVLSALIVFLMPFVDFRFYGFNQTMLALSAGSVFVLAILQLYRALKLFETSRIVPAIGGLTPVFAVLLVFLFSFGNEFLPFSKWPSFALLIIGSVLINWGRKGAGTRRGLVISVYSAFLFALSFVLSGYVYFNQPFWSGLITIKLGGLIPALGLVLFSKEVRQDLFKHRTTFKRKTLSVFIANQVAGAGANLLQNWAIALTPLAFIPVISALQGTQYVFLLILTVLFSFKFPHILKEEISAKILIQKITAIILILLGLGLFFTQ